MTSEPPDAMPEELYVLLHRGIYKGSPHQTEDEDTRYVRADLTPSTTVPPESASEEVIDAAYNYVQTMIPKADGFQPGNAPWWYGWAIREAFIAGTKRTKKQSPSPSGHGDDRQPVQPCGYVVHDKFLVTINSARNFARGFYGQNNVEEYIMPVYRSEPAAKVGENP